MALCRSCAGALSPEARFCSTCGVATAYGEDTSNAGLGASNPTAPPGVTTLAVGAVELLDAPPVQGQSEEVVSTGGSARTRLYAVLGAVALAVLAIVMLRAPDGNDGSKSELAIDENEEGSEDEAPETTRRTTTTRRALTTAGDQAIEATDPATEEPPGPLLGEEVGLTLFIGGGSSLRSIDLDTGVIDDFSMRRFPSLYTDDGWLILTSDSGSKPVAVRADDPRGEQIELDVTGFWGPAHSVVEGSESGQVWMLSGSDDPEWVLIRISDGSVLDRFDLGGAYFGWGVDPGSVLSSAAGGVFRRTQDGYEKVHDGQLIAVDGEIALVRDCADPVTCELTWWSTSNWETLDWNTPESEIGWARLIGGGRILAFWSNSGQSVVFDVARGVELPLDQADLEMLTVSPDGRWLANSSSGLEIFDLDSGEKIDVPGINDYTWDGTVFVPTDQLSG